MSLKNLIVQYIGSVPEIENICYDLLAWQEEEEKEG